MSVNIQKLIRNGAYYSLALCLTFSYLFVFPFSKAGAISSIPISDCVNLQAINNDAVSLADSYIQTASFSCTGIDFTPIGSSGSPFIGIYDGNNFEITDLTIESDASMVGLFGKVSVDGDSIGTIQNVKLVDASVTGTNGFTTVGALVGMNRSAITNSSSTGTVLSDSHHTGGLVGYNTSAGSIADSFSTADVTGTGNYTGGLAGENGGSITDSYAEGIVEGSYYVGGLVGSNNTDWSGAGTIEGSHATGNVTGTGNYVGGLAGYNGSDALISLSYATGDVSGVDYTGGLVGYNYDYSDVQYSYARGDVSGAYATGGLVGYNGDYSNIKFSYATGNVEGTFRVGGLVGENEYGNITQSFATGAVVGTANRVGGLVGSNTGDAEIGIHDAYAIGSVTGDTYVGGLVGANDSGGHIERTYAAGVVTGQSVIATGGLVGMSRVNATVSDSRYDELTGQTDEGKGVLTETENMKSQATFTEGLSDWNFFDIWAIDIHGLNNGGYPYLRWQDYIGPTFEVLGGGETRIVNIDEGQVVTTNPYQIKVLPTDPSQVVKVEFYIDDILICTDYDADTSGNYTCVWDTSLYHSEVKIIAYDALGNPTTVTRSTTVSLVEPPKTGLVHYSNIAAIILIGIGLIALAISRKRSIDGINK